MGGYVIQIFSGGWLVRDSKGFIMVKCPTYDEAVEWIRENN